METRKREAKRRWWVARGIVPGLVIVLAGIIWSAGGAVQAQSSFDWKRYSGTKLRFLVNSHDWESGVIRPALGEFEQLTGIKVGWEVFPEDQFRQKLTVELVSGAGTLDGFMSLTSWDGQRFLKAGWYEPIAKYLQNPALTNPAFDFDDFFPTTREIATVNGTLIGVPLYPEVWILYYRKDVLEANKIEVPRTLDELEAAAKQLTDKGKGFYGFVSRGKRSAAVVTLAPFIFSNGGFWLDKEGRPLLDSPATIKAVSAYARLLREYGPPGALNMTFYEVIDLLAQGRVGLAVEASGFVSVLENPKKSKVVGKIGYTEFPAGPSGSHSPIISWALSISKQSKHKEAAWYFIQWATSKEMALRQAKRQIPVARQSVGNSAEFLSVMPKDWVQAYTQALRNGYPNQANPLVLAVPETRDVIGGVILDAMEGRDVKASAERGQQKLIDILKKTQ